MSEPLDMRGRFNLLPIRDVPNRYIYENGKLSPKRELAVPGIIASMINSASVPGRAMSGENISQQEALGLAMNMTGGGLGSPKPNGTLLGMGGGKINNITQMRAQKVALERQMLNDMAKKMLPKIKELRDRRMQIEQGLNKIRSEAPGISDDDTKLRFILGRDRYQVYQEMQQALKTTKSDLHQYELTYKTASQRYMKLYEDQQRLMDLISDSAPEL